MSVATERLLRDAGLRRTSMRESTLDALMRGGSPMNVPEILRALPERADAVTLYRTLNTFTRHGLVHRVRGEDGARYAFSAPADRPAHPHPHFICDGCGKVECLEGTELPADLIGRFDPGAGRRVDYAELLLHGLCPRCAGKAEG